MISLLKCEAAKTKGRYIFLTMFAITFIELGWILFREYSQALLEHGWMAFLYQFPLINTLFLPVLATVIASRVCDTEHKGQMLKELFCIASKGKLYDAKLLFGLGVIMLSLIMQFGAIFIGGRVLGFGGSFPLKLYGLYWIFTIIPAIAIYIFQHTLSLVFKNQTIGFVTGISGGFLGMFSMLLPQFPWLRNSLLWGWFGALQFVGNNWSRETRINHFYVMDIDWGILVSAVGVCFILYAIGRKLFCEREV